MRIRKTLWVGFTCAHADQRIEHPPIGHINTAWNRFIAIDHPRGDNGTDQTTMRCHHHTLINDRMRKDDPRKRRITTNAPTG